MASCSIKTSAWPPPHLHSSQRIPKPRPRRSPWAGQAAFHALPIGIAFHCNLVGKISLSLQGHRGRLACSAMAVAVSLPRVSYVSGSYP